MSAPTSVLVLSMLALMRACHPAEHSDMLADVEDRCLTQAIYFEAAGEPEQSQRAVAEVVLNRRDIHRTMVCSEVEAPGQFSWFSGWPMRPGNMRLWWDLYVIAHDELMKRPHGVPAKDQVIPIDYTYFCSGDCLRSCSGTIIGKQCYYRGRP